MSLVGLLFAVIIIALLWGLAVKYLPLTEGGKTAIHIVAVLIIIVVLLSFLGFDAWRFRG